MLLLSKASNTSQTRFRDHIDPSIRYMLPDAVTVAETAHSTPDFFLLRYAGDVATERGGILRGMLTLRHPELPAAASADETLIARPVPFIAGYSRLLLRPFGTTDEHDTETGQWHRLDAVEQGRVSLLAYLDTAEARILRALLADTGDVIGMELALIYRGLVAGIPWLARVESEPLNTHMQAMLGDNPASVDQIIAAFLSLPEGVISWQFIGTDEADGAEEPPRNTLYTEAAMHALGRLFEPVDRPDLLTPLRYHYLPRDSALSPQYSYSLLSYRQEERSYSLGWSLSELVERLTPDEREQLFPTVSQVSPFARVNVHIINSLPFDPAYLTSLTVDVKNIGPSGIFENRSFAFSAGAPQVAQFGTFLPMLTSDLELHYRITAVLAAPAPDQWPIVIKRDFRPAAGTVIEINRENAGIESVHLHADSAVFARASAVEVALTSPDAPHPDAAEAANDAALATVTLTAEHAVAQVALPDVAPETALHCLIQATPPAHLAGAEALVLHDGALVGREVAIYAYQLEVLEPDEVTVTLDTEASERYPFVAFEITAEEHASAGTLRTLRPGQSCTWRILRRSIFEPLSYRYRLHVVARNEDGDTLPMVVTEWAASAEHHHTLGTAAIAAYLSNAPDT